MGEVSTSIHHVFTDKQLQHILKRATGEDGWRVVSADGSPASEGLMGFLGDHLRVRVEAARSGEVTRLHLFVKSMPATNQTKADFIDEGNYFRREMLMFKLFEELGGDEGEHPWRPKAFYYSESLLVMPDLSRLGYAPRPHHRTLHLPHLLLTAASIARFHAAFANYATKQSSNGHRYSILDKYGHVLQEPTFCDSLWLRAAAKLSANLLRTFSTKFNDNIPNLEDKLVKLYIEACDSFKEYEDTVNVLIHKDLWANNIMFRYEGGLPSQALLIDFQCVRYGPPAFDLTITLYLNSSRSFRETHEREIYQHYYSVFWECLEEPTRARLKQLKYGLEEFLRWCERARMFGMFMAIGIFPYVLMEPVSARHHFDNPATYLQYCNEDRSDPVLAYCRQDAAYAQRQLHVTEEFVERFALK